MKPISIYRGIAVINGLIGLFVVLGLIALSFSLVRNFEKESHLYIAGMAVVMTIIALGLIWTAISFLKKQNIKNALLLAANSSVIIWVGLTRVIQSTEIPKFTGPAHVVASIVIAYLAYRFALKPLALRVTSNDENGA